MTNLTIHLDEKIREMLKDFAKAKGLSMKIACERAIVRYVKEMQAMETQKK